MQIHKTQKKNKKYKKIIQLKNIEIYLKNNPPQSDLEFVESCFNKPFSKQKKIALTIRCSIAKLGQVDSKFIRANSSFENLAWLPYWKNCGDIRFYTEDFVEVIESELQIQFTEKQLRNASVRDPDLHPEMKINEFIREFYSWYNLNYF
ncbi:MAG: aldehyde dehydrogenase [Cyanobacteria bacterium SID2]|nr:aldehyde dehydrogenase [Cyanobacteria bacterium SID2]